MRISDRSSDVCSSDLELAKAIADGGGVVQIPFGTAFVNPESAADTQAHFRAINDFNKRNAELEAAGKPLESRAAFNKAWEEAHPPRQTHIDAVLDQVDYAVKLIGIDHVGVGSDFDGVGGELPDELRPVDEFPNCVAGLPARGYKDKAIRKILGDHPLQTGAENEAGEGPTTAH